MTSAGIILYKKEDGRVKILLVHPGGPFWSKKDTGAWSIPKGEVGKNENPLEAARREFEEETGLALPESRAKEGFVMNSAEGGSLDRKFLELGSIKYKSGKNVFAWAIEGDFDLSNFKSKTFQMEWPPKSGEFKEFPEADRAEFFDLKTAKEKIVPAQATLLERLENFLK